jgi:glycine/D-amino acid oxidase-like deaminating enzyme
MKLAEAGQSVTIFERREELLLGASVNGNRLHYGFHYPRDAETARQCLRGYREFRQEFGVAIRPGVSNAYFIASQGSLVSPEDYLSFCRGLGLRFQVIEPGAFRPAVRNVSLAILTEEVLYEVTVLRRLIGDRLLRAGVEVRFGTNVDALKRLRGGGFEITAGSGDTARFDAVVNCSYAEINRLTAQLGHPVERRQYEYTAVPIVELDQPNKASVTILDGPFMSLLPYGLKGQHLVYHVEHAVVVREDSPLMNPAWRDPETSPFASIDRQKWLKSYLDSCCEFMPDLRTARVKGVLLSPRMVIADSDDTDARPSFVTLHEPGYVSVFSGKIDHCIWIAEEVRDNLAASLADRVDGADPYRRDPSAGWTARPMR